VVNGIMNGSKVSAKSHSKQTSCNETSNRQGHSKRSTNKDNKRSSIVQCHNMLTHDRATDERESLLVQRSGLAQVTSPGYVSHLYSHV
jgi:hypothetical protein